MSNVRTLSMGLSAAVTAALLALPLFPAAAEAQEGGGRMQVLVIDMKPTDSSQPRFGENASNDLRGLLDLDTHVALNERATDQAARQYNLRRSSLDCTTGRQMAQQMSIPIVFCGEYRTEGNQVLYSGAFYTVPEGEEFRAEEGAVPSNRPREAAEQFREFFVETAEKVEAITLCGQQFQSSSWERAVELCTEAVELSPNSVEARKALGLSLKELERYPEALAQLEQVLEEQPINSSMLENAGWIAAQIGETDKARTYYERYLELNPDNTPVRIQIARDLAEAEDEVGAVALLEEGFEHVTDSTALVELHEQYGGIAFRAAFAEQQRRRANRPEGPEGQGPPDPEVAELFQDAIRSLDYVVERRGPEAPPEYVRNSIAAYVQLGDFRRAIDAGNRGLRFFPRDAQIRARMADAFRGEGNIPEAISQMQQALEIDPELPNARAQMAQMFLSNRQADEAIMWINRAAEAGEQSPDNLASMLFGYGWNEGGQKGDFNLAVRMIEAAKEVEGVTPTLRSQLDFFHGYALYAGADAVLRTTGTLQTCNQHLPRLQNAARVLPGGSAYAQTAGQNLQSVVDAVAGYVDMCTMIIRRDG